jgi:molybdate transport system substrate-binding protein
MSCDCRSSNFHFPFFIFNTRLALFLLALALFVGVFAPSSAPAVPPQTELTLSAAISLKDALDEIKQVYTSENPGISIATNYGASGTLQLQIEQGAPVDVYISAAPKQMDALESKDLLLPGTRRDLLHNEIVLIVPSDSRLGIKSFQDLTRADVKQVALGEPAAVPAGQYAKDVLTHLGIYDAVNSKAILAKDVRQVLTYVETGNVDAGIVYLTDAMTSSKVEVVAQAPEDSHAPVIYPIAAIKGTKNPDSARRLVDFLEGEKAAAIFHKYGFTPAAAAAPTH